MVQRLVQPTDVELREVPPGARHRTDANRRSRPPHRSASRIRAVAGRGPSRRVRMELASGADAGRPDGPRVTVTAMTPEAALDRVMHCLDRAHDKGFRAKAFQRARDVVRTTDPAEIAERAANGTLKKLDGIGDSSAKVIMEALAGEVPHYLAQLEETTHVPITPEGQRYREALR